MKLFLIYLLTILALVFAAIDLLLVSGVVTAVGLSWLTPAAVLALGIAFLLSLLPVPIP